MVKSILLGAIPAQLRIMYHKTTNTVALSSTIMGEAGVDSDNKNKNLKSLLFFIKTEVETLERSALVYLEKKMSSQI